MIIMNIQEATKKAMEEDKCIARESCYWQIKPINNLVFLFDLEEMDIDIPWIPKAEDLIADDWEVIC